MSDKPLIVLYPEPEQYPAIWIFWDGDEEGDGDYDAFEFNTIRQPVQHAAQTDGMLSVYPEEFSVMFEVLGQAVDAGAGISIHRYSDEGDKT